MSEWGPWIEHDGKHAPLGFYLQIKFFNGSDGEGFLDQGAINPDKGFRSRWIYGDLFPEAAIRYRIRKPKGLTILEQILNDLPAPTKPTVPA